MTSKVVTIGALILGILILINTPVGKHIPGVSKLVNHSSVIHTGGENGGTEQEGPHDPDSGHEDGNP